MNAIIHALNALLVFTLFLELMKGREVSDEGRYVAAFTGALLFALHPLRVESVAWLSERKDVLCSLFFISCLTFYLKYARGGSARKAYANYAIALGLCLLALLSKPMAITLPLVLLLLDYYPLERIRAASWRNILLEKVPFLFLSAATVGINILAARGAGVTFAYVPLHVRVMNALYGALFYIKQTVLPDNLLPLYQMDRGLDYFGAPFVLSALVVIALTGCCIGSAYKGYRLWASVWFYYLITLAPALGLFMSYRHAVADRYTYLPTLGFYLVGGLCVGRLWEKAGVHAHRRATRAALIGCVALLTLAYGYKTAQQIAIWKNSETLWTHVLENAYHVPDVAFFGVGLEMEKKGELDRALALYEKALSLNPNNPRYVAQMANVTARKGDPDKALAMYEDLAKTYPRDSAFHFHRGRMFALMGRDEEAVRAFEKALELAPREERARLLHSLAQAAVKDRPKAREYYRKYISEGYAPDPNLERQLGIEQATQRKDR